MNLLFENDQEICVDFSLEEVSRMVCEAVLDRESCPYEAQVNLTLVDNEEIRRLNRDFRSIDRATDVLSFPMVPFESPSDFSILEELDDVFDPETGELLLGDIVLSLERAADQAREFGHSIRREFAFLLAHSMLHLLGYDHLETDQAEDMEARQEKILTDLNITRDREETGNDQA